MAGVSDQIVKFSFVGHQPPGQSFSVGLAVLREFAYDAEALIAVFWQPDFGPGIEGDDGFAESALH